MCDGCMVDLYHKGRGTRNVWGILAGRPERVLGGDGSGGSFLGRPDLRGVQPPFGFYSQLATRGYYYLVDTATLKPLHSRHPPICKRYAPIFAPRGHTPTGHIIGHTLDTSDGPRTEDSPENSVHIQ